MKIASICIGIASALGLAWGAASPSKGDGGVETAAFEALRMHLEVDLPSRWADVGRAPAFPAGLMALPAEVVLETEAAAGLARLRVKNQAGEVLVRLDCPPGAALGVSELALECEGDTLAEALDAFPLGDYVVEATTVDGQALEGRVRLQSGFPGHFAVLSPLPGEIVQTDGATLAWTLPRGAAGYTLEIEQEELGFALEVGLAPWQTSFTVPAEMLQAGRTYEYSLAVQGDTDNELEVEGAFTTATAVKGTQGSGKGF